MYIIPISVSSNYNNKNSIKQNNIIKETPSNNISAPLMQFGYFPISFTGGKSQDLRLTLKSIKDEDYLPGSKIKQLIDDIVTEGNPDEKTLIDIHREYFKKLMTCKTLDEAKKYYPEFKDVKSDSEVKPTKFIKEVKEGKIRGFNPNEDVALQILQLYWGEGCSTADLKNNYADKSILGTFIALNIPRATNSYGLYLKHSDKDFNTRFANAIAQRAKEIEREKQESKYGINPDSEINPEDIKSGLRILSTENPEKVNDLSQKLFNYSKEHPEIGNILSLVMYRAWSYPEALKIREALSVTIQTELSKEIIEKSLDTKNPINKAFKVFWNNNDWAKPILSYCVRKAWAEQDKIDVYDIQKSRNTEFAPKKLQAKIVDFFNSRYPELEQYSYDVLDNTSNKKLSPEQKKAEEALGVFFKENPVEMRNLLYSRLYGIISAFRDIAIMDNQSKEKHFSDLNQMVTIFEKNITNNKQNGLKKENIDNLYSQLMQYCADNNPVAMGIIKGRINSDYNSISKMNMDAIVKYGDFASKEFLKYIQEHNKD